MESKTSEEQTHRDGEEEKPLPIDTPGGRFHVRFDESTPVSALGPLVFFTQFIEVGGRFESLCGQAPLRYSSNNAPEPREVLATLLLGILAGCRRFAHLSALQFDDVAAGLLGVRALVSEDSVRRALYRMDAYEAARWLRAQFDAVVEDMLAEPWVLDTDVTIKPLYGSQEGAACGYNPKKPGRPSHAYHTYWMARVRLCLDVEVRPGNEHGVNYGLDGLFAWLDARERRQWPQFVRGDCGYGQENVMANCEARQLGYLFKLRRTKRARAMVDTLEASDATAWKNAGQGWEAAESELALEGWTRRRRVIALRRPLSQAPGPRAQRRRARRSREPLPLLALMGVPAATVEVLDYEYQILVTSLPYGVEALAAVYRDRGDAENPFDELKNQWGWSGFTSRKLRVCQISARLIALVYNWWSLYARLIDPRQHHEAISSRPRLLGGVARQQQHAGQRHLAVRLLHSEAPVLRVRIEQAVNFLQQLLATAEQLDFAARWRRILRHIFPKEMNACGPAPPTLPAAAT
jgi:hypothetical protein